MNEEIRALIRRAEERLKASWELYSKGYYGFAISSAYYSMFYCARALLLSKGVNPKSHATEEDARDVLKGAEEFLKFTEEYLGV